MSQTRQIFGQNRQTQQKFGQKTFFVEFVEFDQKIFVDWTNSSIISPNSTNSPNSAKNSIFRTIDFSI